MYGTRTCSLLIVVVIIFTVTGGKHELVPKNVYTEAEKFAKV